MISQNAETNQSLKSARWHLSETGEEILYFLITSLKLPTSYLSYSGQLVLCKQGVGGISLYFPLPLRSHYCVMATVLANRPVPPISFPSYITAALSGIKELVWVRLQLLGLSLLMLIRREKTVSPALSNESIVDRTESGFREKKCDQIDMLKGSYYALPYFLSCMAAVYLL